MRQNLINEVYKYGNLRDGWDGEHSKAPSRDMVNQALVLCQRFPENIIPNCMINPNGDIGFYWNFLNVYYDLENDNGVFSFFKDGSFSDEYIERFIDDLTLADLKEDWFNEHIKY